MEQYLKRCIDTRLIDKLDSSGAVWIKGPKWCGKSTTAERYPKSAVFMQSNRTDLSCSSIALVHSLVDEREFDFFLSRKDFGRILRRERVWYLLPQIVILLLLSADGIALGLTIREGAPWWLFAAIPVLATINATIWFFGFTSGGAQIFKRCHASFKEDGTLALSCVRESGFTFQGTTGFEKTMRVKRITERNGYWVVYGDRRQWGVLPKEIPVKELLHMQNAMGF